MVYIMYYYKLKQAVNLGHSMPQPGFVTHHEAPDYHRRLGCKTNCIYFFYLGNPGHDVLRQMSVTEISNGARTPIP
jgi:O-acetylhomoserine/O-acetylserine sulfhydrylase-like pyridoxal-dependent enzyme